MPLTVSFADGNGVADNHYQVSIQLPDGNGGNAIISGLVQAAGQTPEPFGPTTLMLPAAPASGSIYFNVQVDVTSGNATLQQSTSGPPTPIDGNNVIVYSQVLTPTTTVPSDDDGSTPDQAAGAP